MCHYPSRPVLVTVAASGHARIVLRTRRLND